VALIWAAAAAYFFSPESGIDTTGKSGPAMVGLIAETWFAPVIAVITILGVISAAVTSGDTALRSARLIIADFMHSDQKPIRNRLIIAVPMFAVTAGILIYSLASPQGFDVIWRYFAWANQVLSVFTLWAITVYLAIKKKFYWITLIPALFMTMVCSTFIFIAEKEGFGLGKAISYSLGGAITVASCVGFFIWKHFRAAKSKVNED